MNTMIVGRAAFLAACVVSVAAAEEGPLPAGVTAVWDLAKAVRQTTPTRERVCVNGLWRWQPAKGPTDAAPDGRWGHFKVPGCWPGITDYMQKDSQTVWPHASWKDESLGGVTAAWYQREITIPAEWAGRRIALTADCLNSHAAVYLDGKRAGEMRFPAGEVDLTSACRPGQTHVLSLAVTAMPLQAVMLSYSDTASARQVKGSVARRGLCGDVWLVSTPPGPRLDDVRVATSVRKGEVTCSAAAAGLAPDGRYVLRARIADGAKEAGELVSQPFGASDLKAGRIAFTGKWRTEKLWDVHTPGNLHELRLSLLDGAGKVLDEALPVRFGFRELWIDGRDFYLNGSRIYLSAVPLDNAQIGAALACYEGARESLLRLKTFGINFVYAHNYDCRPGAHLSFEEILRAADDVGMLVALSQPHFAQYDWKAADAERTNGYAGHAAYYVGVAGSHPSVIAYATSHNATASGEDMNPDHFGVARTIRDDWSGNNARLAMRVEAIVRALDGGRIVYHHAGDLGSLHACNFYPNFTPIQEMSDWFGPWAAKGVKPVFLCEYGAPFSWDWSMYRGWYQGKRTFGSAVVPWEFCLAEWNAQFYGDRAFAISEREKANLRWEAKQFRAGRLWHRWDYPTQLGSNLLDERQEVLARYTADNWRAFRTLGLSANSPWEHHLFWKLRDGVDKARKDLPVDWQKLQRPGLSPDYVEDRYERMDLAFERADWIASAAAKALYRNNGPLLAYIAGGASAITGKDHNFLPGQSVAKQIVVINNSRRTVTCECRWSLALPKAVAAAGTVEVKTGEQARLPVSVALPGNLPAGAYKLSLTARFSSGEEQTDEFGIDVLAPAPAVQAAPKIALFDPKGETAGLLKAMGVAFRAVDAAADLATFDTLIVGKGALTVGGPGPNVARVRDGLKLLLFEQSADVLEKRLGFRVQEYGLREVYRRVPDHPVLAGLTAANLRDWRGEATTVPPRLEYEHRPMYGPTIRWCGIPATRVWRCGNRGSVASVLIEKPACGDWLAIVDGAFSLQYSPLLVGREGAGIVVLCQMDVTGRTEGDPAADRLVRNLLGWLAAWRAAPRREAIYAGEPAGREYLSKMGLRVGAYDGGELKADQVLIVGPGGGAALAARKADIARWLAQGGKVLAVGLDGAETKSFLPVDVATKKAEHIAAFFDPPAAGSPLAGVGPADVHNRDPMTIDLISAGATSVGGGVLAVGGEGGVVFCQLAPWHFDADKQPNTRRTFRTTARLLARLLGNLGAGAATPLLERISSPVDQAGGANLVANGDFRTDADNNGVADGWQFSAGAGGPTAVREKLPDREGWAQRITCPPAADPKKAGMMIAQHDLPMTQGQWYRITLRAKAQGLGAARVTLAVQNTANWRSVFDYQDITPGEQWQDFSLLVEANVTAPKGTKLQIWHGGAGTLWLADVSIRPCDPPTQGRWLKGLYLDEPREWDDPYRFFRW